MPWQNVTPMEEINRFVILARSGRFSMSDLCEQFGISRKTGYKHLERYTALGLAGLRPRSSRPHGSPQRTDEAEVIPPRMRGRGWPSILTLCSTINQRAPRRVGKTPDALIRL